MNVLKGCDRWIKTFLTCPFVQQEASVLVAGHDAIDDGIGPAAVSRQGRDAQHLRPDRQGFWELSDVLRAEEDGLVVVQGDHVHRDRGDGVEVTRQPAIRGLHLQLEGGRGLGVQGALQTQDPGELVQREVAAVARQEGVLHLRVYTCGRGNMSVKVYQHKHFMIHVVSVM